MERELAMTADETSAAYLVAWAQSYDDNIRYFKDLPIPLAATCATCFLFVQWIVTMLLCRRLKQQNVCGLE